MTDMNRQDAKASKGRLPDGWRWVQLGEVCRVVGGSTPPSGVEANWDGEIVWITPTDLGRLSGQYILGSARRISRTGYESCGTELVLAGSVVLSSRAPVGHLGIAGVSLCTNQGCKSFVPGPEVESTFLYFVLMFNVPLLQAMGSGATFTEVSKSKLQRFEIPLPPLPEQQRIATILSEQMTAVERARAAAEARLEAAKALLAAYLDATFESQDIRRWPSDPLGNVLQLRKEIVHPRDNPKGPATFVGLEHIESITGRRIGSIDLEKAALTGRKPQFYTGDIVYGYLRPYLNKVWVAEFDGLCSVDQYVYSVDRDKANTEFVAWFMRSPGYLRSAPIGTSPGQLPRIRTEEVSSVEIHLPPIAEQERIVRTLKAQVDAAERVRKAVAEELAAINALPAALLRRVFSGAL